VKEFLARAVAGLEVDYADIRYEENRKTRITFQGSRLDEIAEYSASGSHIRVYDRGGKSTASISDPEHIERVAHATAAGARLAGSRRERPLRLAVRPVLSGSFPVRTPDDPRTLSLSDKLALISHYNDQILREPTVVATEASYDEFVSRRTLVTSDGQQVEYELVNVTIYGLIVTKRDGIVQRVRFAFGGCEDGGRLVRREEDLAQLIAVARDLPLAEPAKAGAFPVILDPSEAGLFVHEAFGHLSEADGLQDNPEFRARLRLGAHVGKPILNVTDDPTLPGLPGSCEIDDEGVRARRTRLITDGRLSGRLHSRETAAEFGEPPSGNMRAVDAHFTPLVRMSNIFIEPRGASFDDMVASIDRGYYLCGAKGGQTTGDQFTFGASWGYRIEGGRIGPLVRDINMSGELFSTLAAISMVGDDLSFAERGGCGKGAPQQLNRKSGKGAPHIKIDRVTVGGVG
jgi:TldD protein